MKQTLLYILFFVLITCGFNSAQDHLSRQLDYANNLFENELYYNAITEFNRLQFFDKFNIYEFDSNLKIGLSYKAGAKYDDAINYLKKAEFTARTDSEEYKAKTQIIRTNILRRTTDAALLLLNELETNPKFFDKKNDVKYWRGWAYMIANDWESAATSFAKIDINHPLKKLSDGVKADKYSVTFAKVISYILPGSGQFYTGYYLSGLMSLGWNVLFGYLTINSFIEDRAFDGLVIGGLLWLRFYRGNVQNAESFAIEENIRIANEACRFLKNNYVGIKP